MKSNQPSGSPVRAGDWLTTARQALGSHTETGGLEAQALLGHVLQKPRAWLLAHPELPLSHDQQRRLDDLLERLAGGEPLPYLLGHWEFYGLDFLVTPAVLIPRPETELLVDRALEWLRRNPTRRRAADVGSGSGCIAVSLVRHVPDLEAVATDRSWAALQVTRANAERHAVSTRITLAQSDLLSAFSGPFDLVCANLPYIPHQALDELPVAQHEPRLALDGGADGLDAIRSLLNDAPRWLAPGGLMLLEMQYDQGDAITRLAHQALPEAHVTVHADLAGLPRLVEIERRL